MRLEKLVSIGAFRGFQAVITDPRMIQISYMYLPRCNFLNCTETLK